MGQVKHRGLLSEPSTIKSGVKQSCALPPMFFTSFSSRKLREAKEDLTEGIYIQFWSDGSLFNLSRLLTCTKTQGFLILELLFADDCVLLANSEEVLQKVTYQLLRQQGPSA